MSRLEPDTTRTVAQFRYTYKESVDYLEYKRNNCGKPIEVPKEWFEGASPKNFTITLPEGYGFTFRGRPKTLSEQEVREKEARWKREKRREVKKEQKRQVKQGIQPQVPQSNIADTLVAWCGEKLVVPTSHPKLSGQPMIMPWYIEAAVRDALDADVREVLLCMARKNAKTSGIAMLTLGLLCCPGVARVGTRIASCSLDRDTAGELVKAVIETAEASEIEVEERKVPYPGRVITAAGELVVLSSDKSAGHGGGYDYVLVDEIGLMEERDRELLAGLRSSVSARDGKFISFSVHGDGPFIPEILERDKEGEESLRVHHFKGDPKAATDDEDNWRLSNPGLELGIKSIGHMRSEARRVRITTKDEPKFRAYEMNEPLDPESSPLLPLMDWMACEVAEEDLPERNGPCYLGFDVGGSVSMTALAAYWPLTGRMEAWGSFGSTPKLEERERKDACVGLYTAMQRIGELILTPGRETKVDVFLSYCIDALKGSDIRAIGFDRFRRAATLTAFDDAGIDWLWFPRGTGASATADGTHDVESFRRAAVSGNLKVREGLLLSSAVRAAKVLGDGRGNEALDKRKATARIDSVQAAVIAAGLSALDNAEVRKAQEERRRVLEGDDKPVEGFRTVTF